METGDNRAELLERLRSKRDLPPAKERERIRKAGRYGTCRSAADCRAKRETCDRIAYKPSARGAYRF